MSLDPSRIARVLLGSLLLATACSPQSEPSSFEELGEERAAAQLTAERVLRDERVERVVIGALRGELHNGWEAHTR